MSKISQNNVVKMYFLHFPSYSGDFVTYRQWDLVCTHMTLRCMFSGTLHYGHLVNIVTSLFLLFLSWQNAHGYIFWYENPIPLIWPMVTVRNSVLQNPFIIIISPGLLKIQPSAQISHVHHPILMNATMYQPLPYNQMPLFQCAMN